MHMRIALAPIFVGFLASLVTVGISSAELRFSSTGSWDAEGNKQLQGRPVLLPNWRDFVEIPPPPPNNSPEVAAELAELHKMQEQRDPAAEVAILNERTLAGFSFGDQPYQTLEEKLPKTQRLLEIGSNEINPIVFALKKKHDRVRPSVLDKTLKPCIDNPGHPSYPSGHAAQAYMFAYLFSAIDPKNQATYFQRGSDIAVRREEAGVHFGSDTDAGRELARQLYNKLKNTEAYETQLKLAQLEFHGGTLPPELRNDPPPAPLEPTVTSTTGTPVEEPAPAPKKSGLFEGFIDKFGKK